MIVICPTCQGVGKVRERVDGYNTKSIKCKFCDGQGRVKQTIMYEKIDIKGE